MALEKKSPPFYIVILNYNSWNDTIECIESVLNSSYKSFQIIVLDNNSSNDSEKHIIDYLEGKLKIDAIIKNKHIEFKTRSQLKLPYFYFSKIKDVERKSFITNQDNLIKSTDQETHNLEYPIIFVQTNQNLGFAGGNNVALKAILEDPKINEDTKIFLLNPDTILHPKALIELSKIDMKLFISGMSVRNYFTGEESFQGVYGIFKPFALIKPLKLNDSREIDYVYGGALCTNKRTLSINGLLPEDYFLYWEETDWCYSAKKKDINLLACPSAKVYDKVGTSIGRGFLAYYYYIRNGLYFYKKHLKIFLPSLIMFNFLRVLKRIVKGEFKIAKAILTGIAHFIISKKGAF